MNLNANLASQGFPSISVYLFTILVDDTYSELKVLPTILETITTPSGKNLLERNFTKQSTYFFEPEEQGIYTLKLANLANESTILNGLFGYFPFTGNKGQINSDAFQELFFSSILLLSGLPIILIGILVIIVGISKAAKSNISTLNM